jgi:hypothetical protein
MTKETKDSIYRDLSRKLIKMSMGNKVHIDGIEKQENGEDKIELKRDPEGKIKPNPSSPQQTIFNILSYLIITVTGIIGVIIPLTVCIAYTVYETKAAFEASSIGSLSSLLTFMNPLVIFYFNNIVFTLLMLAAGCSAIGVLLLLKITVDLIEMSILKRVFKKYYKKTATKLKALDEEERIRKEKTRTI